MYTSIIISTQYQKAFQAIGDRNKKMQAGMQHTNQCNRSTTYIHTRNDGTNEGKTRQDERLTSGRRLDEER
jgi:hypothetical protein